MFSSFTNTNLSLALAMITMAGLHDAMRATTAMTDLRGPASNSYPQCIATFTFAPKCGVQWLHESPDAPFPINNTIISKSVLGTCFALCQLNQKETFSPGMCPSGQIITTITEFHNTAGSDGKF